MNPLFISSSVILIIIGIQVPTAFQYKRSSTLLELLDDFILTIEKTEETQACLQDLKKYGQALLNQETWAQSVIDSQHILPPSGLLIGRRHMLGRYEECIEQKPINQTFKMQYCLLKINVPTLDKVYVTLPDEPFKTTLYYGLCVPTGCTPAALNVALNSIQVPITGFHLATVAKFNADPSNCYVENPSIPYATDTWIILAILIVFAVVSLLCTIFCGLKDSKTHKVIKSFCIVNNWYVLQDDSSCSVTCVNGIASLATMWALLGSSARSYFSAPIANSQEFFELMATTKYLLWNNAHFGEDMLLLVAGLTVAIKFARHIEQRGRYDHLVEIIRVYIRWTIPLSICVFYTSSLITQCGSGGAWNLVMEDFAGGCQRYWYYVIFYIQNYVEDLHQCLRTTWLLAAEMQLFWISPIVLFPMLWHPMLSIMLSALLAIISAAVEFYVAQEHDLGPTYNFTRRSGHMLLDYVKTHTRAAPWFIGCTLGLFIVHVQRADKKIKLAKRWATLGWLLCLALLSGAFFSLTAFDREYQQPAAAAVLAVNRLAWGVGVAWVIYACNAGIATPINIFLSWQPFHFLYRLTMCIFIMHEIIVYYYIGLTREPPHIYPFKVYSNSNGFYVMAMLVSVMLWVCFVQPLKRIEELLMKNIKILPVYKSKQLEQNGPPSEAKQKE